MTADTPICRFVRCPKCRLVLPEPADLTLYRCGGCSTILKAKRRQDVGKSAHSNLREMDGCKMNSLEQDPDDGESSSSSKGSCSSSGECSLDQNDPRDSSIYGECDNEQLGSVKLSNGGQNDDSLGQNDRKNCSLSGDSDNEQHGSVNMSNEGQNHGSLEQNDRKNCSLSGDSDNEQHGSVNMSYEGQNHDSLEQNHRKNCSLSGDSDNEQHGSVNMSNEGQNHGSLEQNHRKNCSLSGDSDYEQHGSVNMSNEGQNHGSLEQNDQKDCNLTGDYDGKQLGGGVKLSNDNQNDDSLEQNDQNHFGLSEASDNEQLRGVDLSNKDQNDGSLEQNDQKGFDVSVACDNEQLRGVDLSNEEQSDEMHHKESYEINIEQNGVPKEACSPMDLSSCQDEEMPPLAESNMVVDVNDETSPIAQTNSDVENNDKSDSTLKRSSTEKPMAINGMRQVVTTYGTAREIISSDMLVSSPTERMEHSHEGFACDFDRARSADTLETTDFVNPSSELSGKLIDLSKSPTTRSYHAYYDGSTSSIDSPNHYWHSFDRHRHPLKNSYKVSNRDAPEERPRRNKFPANDDAEKQHQGRRFPSRFSDKMHKWSQVESQKPTGLGYPGGNWRSERDEYSSRLPPCQRGPPIGYGSSSPSTQLSGNSSSQLHDEFYWDPSVHLRNKHVYTEQEKMKLLRMVNDLQDQFNRAYNLNDEMEGRCSAGIARENHMPAHYDHEAMEERSSYNLNYPMFPVRSRQESNWSHQSNFLHGPLSGEATYGRHHMDSCLCCRPPEWQNSARLPLFGPFHNKWSCRIHPNQNFRTSYGSCPSSPHHRLDSEFSLHSRETKSAEQRYKYHGVKRYPREKQHSGKKHVRPIAGAAPFITCHRCLKQLQLPADFLVFGRRCCLKCGACSEVIKFSVKNGTHLVPYLPSFRDPPPSEIEEYSNASDRRNLALASHPSESAKVGPVSYTEDYSFSKSCSSDVDPASFTPLHPVPGNAGDRKMPTDCLKRMEERKTSFSKESRGKNKDPVEVYTSAKPPATTSKARRIPSEIKELPPRSPSPLHRLMGYSSPSEVIKGSGPSGSSRS